MDHYTPIVDAIKSLLELGEAQGCNVLLLTNQGDIASKGLIIIQGGNEKFLLIRTTTPEAKTTQEIHTL